MRRFKISLEEYKRRFMEENRMERIQEQYKILDALQSELESPNIIPDKPFTI